MDSYDIFLEDVDTYLRTSNLTWNKHVEKVAAKTNRSICVIRRTITTSSPCRYEDPSIDYRHIIGLPPLRPKQYPPKPELLINKLQRVQHHSAYWVIGEYQRMASVTEIMATLGWKILDVRKLKIRLAVYNKILNNLIAIHTNPTNHQIQCHKNPPTTTTVSTPGLSHCGMPYQAPQLTQSPQVSPKWSCPSKNMPVLSNQYRGPHSFYIQLLILYLQVCLWGLSLSNAMLISQVLCMLKYMLMIAICHMRHLWRFEDITGQSSSKNKHFDGLCCGTIIKPMETST